MFLGFEDAFTDLQSEFVSLCLEYLSNANVVADKVYIYMYQAGQERQFNVFFDIGGSIVPPSGVATDEQAQELLSVGVEDISRLRKLCDKYQHPCPNEFKLTFEVKTNKFDADYGYEDYSEKNETDSLQAFIKWVGEIKRKSSS